MEKTGHRNQRDLRANSLHWTSAALFSALYSPVLCVSSFKSLKGWRFYCFPLGDHSRVEQVSLFDPTRPTVMEELCQNPLDCFENLNAGAGVWAPNFENAPPVGKGNHLSEEQSQRT